MMHTGYMVCFPVGEYGLLRPYSLSTTKDDGVSFMKGGLFWLTLLKSHDQRPSFGDNLAGRIPRQSRSLRLLVTLQPHSGIRERTESEAGF